MRRAWWLVLLLSVGLNIGLVWATVGRDRPLSAPSRRAVSAAEALPADSAGMQRWAGRHCRMLARELGLKAACADSLGEVHCHWLPRIRANRQEVARRRMALAAACREPELSDVTVMARLQDLSAAQARLDSVVTVAMLQELRLLAPEQRDAYLRLMAWERHHGEPGGPGSPRDGHGGGPGGPGGRARHPRAERNDPPGGGPPPTASSAPVP